MIIGNKIVRKYNGVTLTKMEYQDFIDIGVTDEAYDTNLDMFSDYFMGSDKCVYEFSGNQYCGHWDVKTFTTWFNEIVESDN